MPGNDITFCHFLAYLLAAVGPFAKQETGLSKDIRLFR